MEALERRGFEFPLEDIVEGPGPFVAGEPWKIPVFQANLSTMPNTRGVTTAQIFRNKMENST